MSMDAAAAAAGLSELGLLPSIASALMPASMLGAGGERGHRGGAGSRGSEGGDIEGGAIPGKNGKGGGG